MEEALNDGLWVDVMVGVTGWNCTNKPWSSRCNAHTEIELKILDFKGRCDSNNIITNSNVLLYVRLSQLCNKKMIFEFKWKIFTFN